MPEPSQGANRAGCTGLTSVGSAKARWAIGGPSSGVLSTWLESWRKVAVALSVMTNSVVRYRDAIHPNCALTSYPVSLTRGPGYLLGMHRVPCSIRGEEADDGDGRLGGGAIG